MRYIVIIWSWVWCVNVSFQEGEKTALQEEREEEANKSDSDKDTPRYELYQSNNVSLRSQNKTHFESFRINIGSHSPFRTKVKTSGNMMKFWTMIEEES